MDFARPSARLPRNPQEREAWQRVVVILEHCPLKATQSEARGWELLCERHRNNLLKRGEDPAAWRPDVVHQSLLHLQDCALNRAGKLQVFLHTRDGTLIFVDPRLRVPRSPRLFDKMLCDALFRLRVRSTSGYVQLLKVIKNPITDHLPPNTRFIRVEKDGDFVDPFALARELFPSSCQVPGARAALHVAGALPRQAVASLQDLGAASRIVAEPVVAFVVGGMSKGDVEADYAKKEVVRSIRLADRGMTAAAVCSQLCHAFEELWIGDES